MRLNESSLHWEHGVLATGRPQKREGNSREGGSSGGINLSGGGMLKASNLVLNMVSLRSLLGNPNADTSEKLNKRSRVQWGRMV